MTAPAAAAPTTRDVLDAGVLSATPDYIAAQRLAAQTEHHRSQMLREAQRFVKQLGGAL